MNRYPVVLLLSMLAALFVVPMSPVSGGNRKDRPNGILTTNFYRPFMANNVFNYYANNGDGSMNPHSGDGEGFEFPAGSGKHMIYEDGIVWGGFQSGTLKVGGSTYWHGVQAGKILPSGNADDPSLAKNRIYSVRRDISPSTPFTDARVQALLATDLAAIGRYESGSLQSLYDQYVQVGWSGLLQMGRLFRI